MENGRELTAEEKRALGELENRIMAGREEYHKIPVPEELERRIRHATAEAGGIRRFRIPAVIAAAVAVLILLPNTGENVAYVMGSLPVVGKLFQAVTFRDYQFESDHYNADVEVPQITVEDVTEEGPGSEPAETEATRQINFDINEVTDRLIEEFEESVQTEEGYGTLEVHHETVTDNARYFTLKLSIFQAAGSGAESFRFYTIDKQSGRQVQLKDLFRENSGYSEVLSEEIRSQMRALMAEDEMNMYWVDSTDMPELNWQGVKEDQNFYFDADNDLVLVFDEYEVAPGYMGAQEFTVEREVFEGLLQ